MSRKEQRLVYPGEERWLVSDLRNGQSRDLCEGEVVRSAVYAFSVSDLTTLPIWLQGKGAGDRELTREMLSMQLERAGLELSAAEEGEGSQDFTFWPLAGGADRNLFSTATLNSGELGATALRGARFDLSSRLVQIPDNSAAVWRELGRQVIAFKRGGHIVYQQVLAGNGRGTDTVSEIRCILAQLELTGAMERLEGILLYLPAEEGGAIASRIESDLAIPARVADLNSPELPPSALDLRPQSGTEQRQLSRHHRQVRGLIFGSLLLLGMLLLGWWGSLFLQNKRITTALEGFEESTAEIGKIREAQEKWQELAPAIDPNRYPLELLFQCSELLAEGGVNLTLFELDEDELTLNGEAVTVGHAMRMREALKTGDGPLSNLSWDYPAPQILEDGGSTFSATGK